MRHEQFQPLNRRQHRDARRGLHDEMRELVERFAQGSEAQDASSVVTSQWVPRVDIREERARFVILADLPGVDPQDVEIWMDKGILSLKGERRASAGESGDDASEVRFSRIERSAGQFHRRFSLPDSADANAVTATGHNGVLEISIPKLPETTPRRIEVGTTQDPATRQ
ncbi:Hsp20/alpha crystallin family protein [Luteimonas cellulosilyticus]|uniref:Hsp20/alpha crystallin family protein n=1 Tax=Luteimonas cellulosilyticus TaxID=2683586 RepID=UPI0013571A76|nr:Hsp20/alpha crystallin family protein [Luteimonas cellulosilyticus]